MKTEPVVSPTMMLSVLIKGNQDDKAEVYSFKNHKADAGQRNRRKNRALITAAKGL